MTLDVSIVIVSWNAKAFLLGCLKSLRENSELLRTEVIVVDNASQDGAPDAVASAFPEAVVIRNDDNLGFAKANNIGIERSRGRYVALINSDVEVLPDCLQTMLACMDANPAVGIMGPKVLNKDGSVQFSAIPRRFPTVLRMLCRAVALDSLFPSLTHFMSGCTENVEVLSGCFWLVRREALTQVGLLDDGFFMYAEDIDWCKRFVAAGWKAMFCRKAAVVHFGGASSAAAPLRFYIEMRRADLRYWRKHHGRTGQIAYAAIIFLHDGLRLAGRLLLAILPGVGGKMNTYKLKRSAAALGWLLSSERRSFDHP